MERNDEEGQAQESSCGGAGQIRGASTERSQKARQQRERPQGRFGQKPQEDCRSAAELPAATSWAAQEAVNLLIQFICARYGQPAIGWGDGGIRYRAAGHQGMNARGLFPMPPPEGRGTQLGLLCACGRRPIELKSQRCCRL